jgi:hypothetical protein
MHDDNLRQVINLLRATTWLGSQIQRKEVKYAQARLSDVECPCLAY